MRIFIALCITVFIGACASTDGSGSSTGTQSVAFSMSGGANGSFQSAKHFVILDDETIWHVEEERIKKYVSYVLQYRGLPEVASEEEADYLLFVNYVDVDQDVNEQRLVLTATSKRVYKALGELRPAWVAASKHFGIPPNPIQMLPMHTLSIREFAGGNPYQASMGYKVDSPQVIRLMESVENARSQTGIDN